MTSHSVNGNLSPWSSPCWLGLYQEAIDDIENGDFRSFIPMIINKGDDVVDDVHPTRKEHSEGIYI